jgi:hypothetical protein
LYLQRETVYPFTIYDKSEKEDVRDVELAELIKELEL